MAALFESLDYLYQPAPEISPAIAFYTEMLGGELLWRIHDGDTWVAAVRLVTPGPVVLLASHLAAGGSLLIYRTRSVKETQRALAERGWSAEDPFEIPQGPCLVFRDPGGQRLAAYERVRPRMDEHFLGRFDPL
jgi:hypothetical protein